MVGEKNTEKLAGILLKAGALALVLFLCWYFRSVLVYVLVAFVVSLIGQPVMRLLRKLRVRGKSAPDWLLAIVTLVLLFVVFGLFITRIIPVVTGIVGDATALNSNELPYNNLIEQFNRWLVSVFPALGNDFDIVAATLARIREVINFSNLSSVLGSVASAAASVAVGLFSVVFISFFFIKDDKLFGRIVAALVPDRIESSVAKTLNDITRLLSRYFVGLVVEVLGVILVDFLGLWLIARIGVDYAIGIAFIAGLLNIIPYVGPLIGEVLGVILCLVLKYGAGVGLAVPIWAFALIVFAVMLGAQLIDNFIYQPLIYSTSIRSTPLEIFIVLLLAGRLGGTLGLLVGIPVYTVIRVIAIRFFSHKKAVRRLIPDIDKENSALEK